MNDLRERLLVEVVCRDCGETAHVSNRMSEIGHVCPKCYGVMRPRASGITEDT